MQRTGQPLATADTLRTALDALDVADPASLPLAQVAAEIDDLTGAAERIDRLLVRRIAVWDREAGWRVDGHASPVPGLVARTSTDTRSARRRVRLGRFLTRWPAVDDALAAGGISTEHVQALARVVCRERAELFRRDQHVLLDTARRLPIDDFDALCRRWAAYADDAIDRRPRSERELVPLRRLRLTDLDNGMTALDGLLTADGAAVLRAALDGVDRLDPAGTPDGPRTQAQRAADNLVTIAGRSLARPDGSHDPEATVVVHIDADVLEGTTPAGVASTRPHGRCGTDDDAALTPETARRFACDSWITSVLFSAEREVLAHGRRRRLFSAAQRRALVARDGGCVFPGCDRPPSWCRTHHLDPWAPPTLGQTDLANGCLVCDRHHRLVHEGRWHLVHEPDGGWSAYDHLHRPVAATGPDGLRRPPPSFDRHRPPHPPQRC